MKVRRGGGVIGPLAWTAATARVLAWNRLAADRELLQKAQLEALRQNCRAAARTEFGRAHRLGEVSTHAEFRERVPLRPYAEFEPFLEKMRKGTPDVLWPGLIRHFGQSSGSSQTLAQHKFLPISDEQIRWQQKAAFDVVARYIAHAGHGRFLGGFTLGLFPPSTLKLDGQVATTNNPGLMQRNVPWPVREGVLPKQDLRDIPDYDEKLERMAAAYLDHDVRALSGTTCWFSLFFDKLLRAAQARNLRVSTVSDLWPNLEVLFGGGINAEPYRPVIEKRVGRPVVIMDNYNATEGGIFAVTDRIGEPGMLMVPDRGVFFEFVAASEHGTPDARRLALWEIEPGVDYSIAVTTSSGLFGYLVGDLVQFQSVFPHRLEFVGRTSGVLSLTQELTSFVEIERAIDAAVRATSCSVVEFSAGAEVGVGGTGKGRYQLFVEFEEPPADLRRFASAFDESLCAQNRVYREHRAANVAILPPALFALPPGGARRFMDDIGRRSPQQKFPRVVENSKRDILVKYATLIELPWERA
jgi:GH3 auxin-responsive promoter